MSLLTEIQRRRKDNRLIVGLALAVLLVWAAVSVLERRADDPATITRGLILFVLSYLNITLIAAVLFVFGRTLVKTWLARRRGELGSQFTTKLLLSYVVLTAIPIGVLFFTATGLLQRSIDRWFSTPVREVVDKARVLQDLAERRILQEALDAARDLAAGAAEPSAPALELFRREHRLDSVEIYRQGRRVAVAAEHPAEVEPLARDNLGETKIEVLRDGSHRYRAPRGVGGDIWVAGVRIPPAEARALAGIAAAWSEYRKLEVQKPAIKAANISTFLLITLAILFASIWTGTTLARRITGPIAALAESTARLRAGDLSARVAVPADDELGVLVDSFNGMAAGLQETRDALLRSNEDLQASNQRLDLERRLFSTVLTSVTTGVLAFDADGQVLVCNPAARSLLSLSGDVSLESLREMTRLSPLVALIDQARAGTGASGQWTVPGEEGEERLEAAVRPLAPAAGERAGWVVAIENTTHVAREQKLAAWSEVARRVAHEIKNPLTPIRLSAERIARRLRSGEPGLAEAVERGTRVIVEEVDFLTSLVDEFTRFARLPEMHPEPTDLPALARSAVRLFEGAREGVTIRVESNLHQETATLDPEQIKRMLINLIDNALEACGASGEILVRLERREAGITIEVADTGRGVPTRDREKLFLPDFTTKGRGTGLGLAIVSRIVADHNGTIRVEDNRPSGARFIIELPGSVKSQRVLVIDDEKGIRETLSAILSDEGYAVTTVASGEEGFRRLLEETYDLVFLDVWLKDRDGLSILEAAGPRLRQVPVVMISGHANVEMAVRALRLGADDFLEKPLSLERVLLTARKAIERRDLLAEVASFRGKAQGEEELLGDSSAMTRLKEEIARVAPTDARALIVGENGTGKELVARALHRLSARAESPLIEVNCAAIPEELIESELFGHVRGSFTGASEDRRGKFEEADGATLFLDEVGDMSPKTQAKVLRALQEGRFTPVGGTRPVSSDARILSATNKDLPAEIRRGTFREDLYFRLAVVPLQVPALRERPEDIPRLAEHFLKSAARHFGMKPRLLTPGALQALQNYGWPGNVRELKNVVERLMILGPTEEIGAEDLPFPAVAAGVAADGTLKQAREEFERRYILAALRRHRGNVTRTAEALDVERSHLHRKLKGYGIEVERE